MYSESCKMAIRVVKHRIFNRFLNIILTSLIEELEEELKNKKHVWTRNWLLRRDRYSWGFSWTFKRASNWGSSRIQTIHEKNTNSVWMFVKKSVFYYSKSWYDYGLTIPANFNKLDLSIKSYQFYYSLVTNLELIKKNLFHIL